MQLVRVLYCKLMTNSKQLSTFPLEVGPGTKLQSQRWEATVLPVWDHIYNPIAIVEELPKY